MGFNSAFKGLNFHSVVVWLLSSLKDFKPAKERNIPEDLDLQSGHSRLLIFSNLSGARPYDSGRREKKLKSTDLVYRTLFTEANILVNFTLYLHS